MGPSDSHDGHDTAALLSDIPPRPFPTYDALSYLDFLHTHLVPNTPFLLSARATAAWPARRDWANKTTYPSAPRLAGLRGYTAHVVPVADTFSREFSEFARAERLLGDVLDLWENGKGEGLYVKDWHLVAELEARGGAGGEVYAPPECFRDDWLSPPFDAPNARNAGTSTSTSTADFRFVYAGPAGTFTPLHADVYGSYSWSANVVGRKVWWLFPPGVERELVDARGELLFDIRENGEERGVKILQEEGEVLFVPSGWHHQVVNVDFCISINHNFFASPTLARVYAALRRSQARCAASIADVEADIRARLGDARRADGARAWEAEWAEEVDALLARDAGWGWAGFWACVRDNVATPPARPKLSPPRAERDAFVRAVLDEYKRSPEYVLLPAARAVVDDVERLLDTP